MVKVRVLLTKLVSKEESKQKNYPLEFYTHPEYTEKNWTFLLHVRGYIMMICEFLHFTETQHWSWYLFVKKTLVFGNIYVKRSFGLYFLLLSIRMHFFYYSVAKLFAFFSIYCFHSRGFSHRLWMRLLLLLKSKLQPYMHMAVSMHIAP